MSTTVVTPLQERSTRIEPGYDMVDGVLVKKDIGAEGDWIAERISHRVAGYVDARGLGHVFGQGGGYEFPALAGGRLRFPDVSFVAAGRLPGERPPERWMGIPPDLVVEVVSPNDEAEEVEAKTKAWIEAGVRLAWVVYPRARRVHVFRPDGTASVVESGGHLSGEGVMPGFQCALDEIFPAPAPSGAEDGRGSAEAPQT